MKKITILTAFIFLCSFLKAQNCDPEDLSLEGLKHYEKAEVYRINLPKGTHEQYIEELEAVLKTDSQWQCSIIYKQLGLACEYMYTTKSHTQKKEYLNKSILYYKKYQELERSDREITKKIAKLEAELEVIANTINDSIKIEMVFVEGMLNEDTTACLHSFYIGKYEVTQKQWQSVMNSNPSHFRGPNLPVEQITSDYQLFINELNRITGSHYRVPTLIEWFYAARGGKNKENYAYSGGFAENKVAWFSSNSGNRTHVVGEKEPNSLGIYDMSGNVNEICLLEKYYFKRYDHGRWDPVWKEKHHKAFGGSYNSKPFVINSDSLSFYEFMQSGEYYEHNDYIGVWPEYSVNDKKTDNIGLRLALDVDHNSLSAEEQQWDTWIKQKNEKLQKEKAEEKTETGTRVYYRNRDDYRISTRWGMRLDYHFQTNGPIEPNDVFVNKFFQHTMFGFNFRCLIGRYFYIEPQIKAGIESDWKTISEQNRLRDQFSTCFNSVQNIYLEIPLILGGIYRQDFSAIRGYVAVPYCPHIPTNQYNSETNRKTHFSLLFGIGFDIGSRITTDLYYRKPLTNESNMAPKGFAASLGIIF